MSAVRITRAFDPVRTGARWEQDVYFRLADRQTPQNIWAGCSADVVLSPKSAVTRASKTIRLELTDVQVVDDEARVSIRVPEDRTADFTPADYDIELYRVSAGGDRFSAAIGEIIIQQGLSEIADGQPIVTMGAALGATAGTIIVIPTGSSLSTGAGPAGRSAFQAGLDLEIIPEGMTEAEYVARPLESADAADEVREATDLVRLATLQAKGATETATQAAQDKTAQTEAVRAATDGVRVATDQVRQDTLVVKGQAQAVVDASPALMAAKDVAVGAASSAETSRVGAAASREEVRQVADRSSPLYFADLQVIAALIDIQLRGLFLTEDGVVRGKLGVDVGLNLTKVYDPDTGITTLSFQTLSRPLQVGDAGTVEASSPLYALDQRILTGFLDSGLGIWAAGLEDGSFYIPKLIGQMPLLAGLNGLTVAYDGATGKTTLSLGTIDGEIPISGGASIDNRSSLYVGDYLAGLILQDANARVWAAGLLDGRFYIPKLLVGSIETAGGALSSIGTGLETNEGLYFVKAASGYQQVFRLSKTTGLQTQLTTLGNNSGLFLASDGASIVYTSDRSGALVQYQQPLGGGVEALVVSSTDLVLIGDSRTAGMTGAMATAFPTRAVDNQGVGGQKSPEITDRFSGGPVAVTVAGGSIPASGSVNVTSIAPDVWTHWNYTTGAMHCVIAGVPGILTYNSANSPPRAFVRDTAGSAVAVSSPVNATIDGATVQGSTSAAGAKTLVDLRQRTAIFAPGYNDLAVGLITGGFTYSRAALLANFAELVAALSPKIKHFLVPGIYVGEYGLVNGGGGLAAGQSTLGAAPTAAASQAFLDEILAVNAALAAAYPTQFIDMQGLLAATYGETATVLGTSYTLLNPTCLPDGIHAGTPGNAAVAGIYSTALASKGW